MSGRRLDLHTGMASIRAYEMELFGRLLDGLERIPGCHVWGVTDRSRLMTERTPTAAVTFPGLAPRAIAEALGRRGIATWDGHFYAQALMERLGLGEDGVLRARPEPLQHRGRGRPPARRPRGRRRRRHRRTCIPGGGTGVTGRAFGAQSMTAPLREVLVKRPGAAFGAAFDDPAHGFLHPVDLAVAQREHDAFVEILAGLGPTVHVLDERDRQPDLVYMFDPARS